MEAKDTVAVRGGKRMEAKHMAPFRRVAVRGGKTHGGTLWL